MTFAMEIQENMSSHLIRNTVPIVAINITSDSNV